MLWAAACPKAIKSKFLSCGIALTAYESGTVRLSLPSTPLKFDDLDALASGFSHGAHEPAVFIQD
jgi:hypothetical protein